MIYFTFDWEIGMNRNIDYLGSTEITGADRPHSDEIYEQLDAITSGLVEAI